MFDEINCKYPLPNSDLIDTSNFQTKFRNYYLDEYSCQDKFSIKDCTTVESKEVSCREISYDEFSKRINSDYWNQ